MSNYVDFFTYFEPSKTDVGVFSDDISQYPPLFLKKVCDQLINHRDYRNLIDLDSLNLKVLYDKRFIETADYLKKIPLIVEQVRSIVERRLNRSIAISSLIQILEQNHLAIFY
ncbi:MAG: hypothetical protein JHC93_01885 [Parachlamydiales bacterium]|nr:hypothetical protein [Parachlamydiales bacterium]